MAIWILSILCILLGASVILLFNQKEEILKDCKEEATLKKDKSFLFNMLELEAKAYSDSLNKLPDIRKCKTNITINFKENIFTVNLNSTYERFDSKLKETRNITVFYRLLDKNCFSEDDCIPEENFPDVYKFISNNLKYKAYTLGDSRAFLSNLDEHMFKGTLVCSGRFEGEENDIEYLGGCCLVLPYDLSELVKNIEVDDTPLKVKINSAKTFNNTTNKKIETLVSKINDIDITVSISEYIENAEEIMKLLASSKDKKEFNSLYEPFKISSDLIHDLLKKFWNLKVHKKLTSEEEKDIQDKIDVEIFKCSKLAKMEDV